MNNEDMDGAFLGGGAIEHAVKDGEIYLRANQVAQLLGQTGVKMALQAIQDNDPASASTAHFIMIISEKVYELRSELLKREIEASFSFDDLNDFLLSDGQLDLTEDED